MDNIIIKKIWNDSDTIEFNNFFEIKLTCINEFLRISENVYITDKIAKDLSKTIKKSINNNQEVYFEVSINEVEPEFSIKIFPADVHGYVLIEMNVEIADNDEKMHYAIFYIKTEIGLLDSFADKIGKLVSLAIDEEISLINNCN